MNFLPTTTLSWMIKFRFRSSTHHSSLTWRERLPPAHCIRFDWERPWAKVAWGSGDAWNATIKSTLLWWLCNETNTRMRVLELYFLKFQKTKKCSTTCIWEVNYWNWKYFLFKYLFFICMRSFTVTLYVYSDLVLETQISPITR